MIARMLINAQRPEELRVAVVVDRRLELFQTALAEGGLFRGNIYRGTVVKLQPALNAAFVDLGLEKHGFLAFHDIVPQAFHRKPSGGRPHRLDEVLERGRPILVQVTKDPGGQKGSALTTNVSIAGRYLVLTPFDTTRGVSRKVEDEDIRKQLKDIVSGLELPTGAGVIVRTNALGQTKTALAKDLAALLRLWKRVETGGQQGRGPRLLYSDQDLIVQALRDFLDSSVSEVLVDDDDAFTKAEEYMKAFMPRSKTKLVRYTERMPLFARFDLEPQIESILQRSVALPGGGSIVIDTTEALTAIDVNSGKARSQSQDEAIFQVNREAAREVARQLRLRDIGGLVVVDFIDMRPSRHQREVERTLREALKPDHARCWVGRISPNGLLEINRQRIKQSLGVRTRRPCPTCGGVGSIASAEAVALGLLRRIEAEAAGGRLRAVRIELHPELADALQNNRRRELAALEQEFDLRIEIIAAAGFHRSEQRVELSHRELPMVRVAAAAEPVVSAADLAQEPDGQPGEEKRGRRKKAAKPEPKTEPPPEPVDEPAEPSGEKRHRRRRGGRRRKAREEPSAGHAEPDSEPAPPLVETPPKQSKSKRHTGKHSGEESTEGAEQPAAAAPATAAPAADGAEPANEKRRRRKRGGRKHRSQEPSQGDASAGSPPAAATPDVTPASGADTPGPAESSSRSSRRHRRHRRRPLPSEEPAA
ncbi:MAG: Rne/Rng family ribonuclease [Thermoanaerobaculaceae bacterium]|nr:Rne/Rng family ribonuclease [Thermoanaerobaculaceae bacterium]MDI9621692.1 Rne/Rng family ribonuclease [Acidobacteriota bacterium]NLH11497.1 Rne/Rng family ribonuclease [Holophagae bacterium]HPW55588.1 Rne/Rng family ribonuclease [Thermoanaerobaculaceae bacterium]